MRQAGFGASAAGARDDCAPLVGSDFSSDYYVANTFDVDGNSLEFVHHSEPLITASGRYSTVCHMCARAPASCRGGPDDAGAPIAMRPLVLRGGGACRAVKCE